MPWARSAITLARRDWGRSIYRYRGSKDLSRAAQVGVHTVEQDVALAVKVAFFGALAADEQREVAQDAVKTYGAMQVRDATVGPLFGTCAVSGCATSKRS